VANSKTALRVHLRLTVKRGVTVHGRGFKWREARDAGLAMRRWIRRGKRKAGALVSSTWRWLSTCARGNAGMLHRACVGSFAGRSRSGAAVVSRWSDSNLPRTENGSSRATSRASVTPTSRLSCTTQSRTAQQGSPTPSSHENCGPGPETEHGAQSVVGPSRPLSFPRGAARPKNPPLLALAELQK